MSSKQEKKDKDAFIKSYRRAEVAKAYLTVCRSAIGICRHLGYPDERVGMIRKDIQAIQEEWKQSQIKDFDLARAEIIQTLQRVEEEAWEGWRRSQTDAEQTRIGETKEPGSSTKKSGGMKVKETTTSLLKEKRDGDPRFLNIIKDIEMRKAELLGLVNLDRDELSAAPPIQQIIIRPCVARTDDRIGTQEKLPQIEAVDVESAPVETKPTDVDTPPSGTSY